MDAIVKPSLPPKMGYVEVIDENGKHVYKPTPETEERLALNARIATMETGKAEQTDVDELNEALNMILTGYTGEEAADEAGT